MQFKQIFVTLFLASTALAIAIPDDDFSNSSLESRDNDNTDVDGNVIAETDFLGDNLTDEGAPEWTAAELAGEGEGPEDNLATRDIESRANKGAKIVATAAKYKGVKYNKSCKAKAPFGPSNGMDCSCLTRTSVYGGTKKTIREYLFPFPYKKVAHFQYLARVSKDQYNHPAKGCKKVARAKALPGDILAYGCKGSSSSGIHHVTIFAGKNKMWEAPHSGSFVRYVSVYKKEICPKAIR